MKPLSRVRLFATLWTVARQAPLSMGFSRQEYWSGLPFPSPGDLPNSGIGPRSPALQTDALSSEPPTSGKGSHFISFVHLTTYYVCSTYIIQIYAVRLKMDSKYLVNSHILYMLYLNWY